MKGSPGATTTSLALAACWPDPQFECVVVEADPAGGDISVWFDLPVTPGLVSLAAAGRRNGDPLLVWRHVQSLPGGLSVVMAPVGADPARAALTALGDAAVLKRAAGLDQSVIVADCGRLDPAVLPVLRVADQTLVVVRARTADLAHLASRLSTVTAVARQVQVVLVGSGHPAEEVARELDITVAGSIPDPRQRATMLSGYPAPRSYPPLTKAVARIAADLAATPELPIAGTGTDGVVANGEAIDALEFAHRNGHAGHGAPR